MRKLLLAAAIAMISMPTLAQQQPDPAAMQKVIAALQQQRNQAMDQAAGVQVEAQRLSEENAKLKAEIEALKAKTPADAPK